MQASAKHPLPKTTAALTQRAEQGPQGGAQLGIWRGGEVVADLALGEAAPGVAMTPDHLLPWHSAGKPITAVAVMQLVERGDVSLDTPVAEVLPEFGQGGKEAVTLHHLLTHTAGFRGLKSRVPSGMTGDEAWKRISEMELEPGWVVGESAGYHPLTSWFVLGRVIEAVTGEPLGPLLRARVLEPLGMRDSWVGMPEDIFEPYQKQGRLAATFDTSGDEPRPTRDASATSLTGTNPGGNACGPAHDLARFYESLRRGGELDGQRVLHPETVSDMTRRHRTGMRDRTFLFDMEWGLGLILEPARRTGRMPYGYGQHAGEHTFGHGGVQSVAGFADPDNELSVALIFNTMPGERPHQERVDDVLTALYEDLGMFA